MLNSTIRIQDENGNICYLETPVKIHSSADIYLQEDDYAYSGDFVLKTVQKNIVLNHFLPLEDYLAGVIQNEIGNKCTRRSP